MNKLNLKLLIVVASIAIFIFACVTSIFTINYYNQKVQCLYSGIVYENGAEFDSIDGCNLCKCNGGEVSCTLRACAGNSNLPTKGLEIYCYVDGNNQLYSILPGTNRQKTYDEVTGEATNFSPKIYHMNKTKEEATSILVDKFEYSDEDAATAVAACTPAEKLRMSN